MFSFLLGKGKPAKNQVLEKKTVTYKLPVETKYGDIQIDFLENDVILHNNQGTFHVTKIIQHGWNLIAHHTTETQMEPKYLFEKYDRCEIKLAKYWYRTDPEKHLELQVVNNRQETEDHLHLYFQPQQPQKIKKSIYWECMDKLLDIIDKTGT